MMKKEILNSIINKNKYQTAINVLKEAFIALDKSDIVDTCWFKYLKELEKENQELKKIIQKLLNGLNNIVECKPKEIRGFILLLIEDFEDRFKEVLGE